jgi:hypothetical protein
VFDPFPVGSGGNGQWVSIVWAVIGTSGSDASFRTDHWVFTRRTGSIAGRVFSDLDGLGTDDGEPGFPNVGPELSDVSGRRVRTLLAEEREAGSHRVVWDGRDSEGRPLASGVFCYTLTAPSDRETRRLVLLT